MKSFFFFLVLFLAFQTTPYSQTFDGSWLCLYATWDEQPNSTGYNTPSVGVIKENTFVALVRRGTNTTNYLVGYTNADSMNGRMGSYGYGTSGVGGYRQPWVSGFDYIEMREAMDLAASPDSLVFVANNDQERNILVFRMSADSVISTEYRMVTGADSVYAIDIDASKRVYVTQIINDAPGKVLVFNSIANDPNWATAHNSAPMTSFTVPDAGELRGITVNPEGTVIYVSNYTAKKVYCYIGSPSSGYQLYAPFTINFNDTKIATTGDTLRPGPWGLNYLPNKNILALAADLSFLGGSAYEYGKIFFINPNTGAFMDTIDCAEWNYLMTGGYQTRSGGTTPGNASGYTSPYYVDFDANGNVYTVSYYGWTVDKWNYTGTLPTIPLTIVGIKKDESAIPSQFELMQNYPNPFNPATTIKFALTNSGNISLDIFNINGEMISELISNAYFENGVYTIEFNASLLPSGTYIYRLSNGSSSISKKMTILK